MVELYWYRQKMNFLKMEPLVITCVKIRPATHNLRILALFTISLKFQYDDDIHKAIFLHCQIQDLGADGFQSV